MESKAVIKVSNLSKRYAIGAQKESSLRGTLSAMFGSKNKQKNQDFWALKDVTFDISKGEVVGIIGKNGAGKSTLLKILSQITKPSMGRIEIAGRVASLLEVGTGFHPDLTGRENIYLNGTILGMTRQEVKDKFDEIVSFSGVEKFINTPVKHYSSGMYVRLAFAVAAHLEPEILIVDEVLAVGDSEFQEKCLGKMKDVSSEGRTVIFVSHNLAAVQSLCNKGIYLEEGKLMNVGAIDHILDSYRQGKKTNTNTYFSERKTDEKHEISFQSIEVLDKEKKLCSEFTCDEEILIEFTFHISSLRRKYNIFITIKDKYGFPVFSAERVIDQENLTLRIKPNFLTRGNYNIQTFIHIPTVLQLEALDDICHFSITDMNSPFVIHGDYNYGHVFGSYEWLEGSVLR